MRLPMRPRTYHRHRPPCRSFLQQNLLRTLTPGSLAAQPRLTYLNLSGNQLRGLEGLEGCGALCTLLAADNCLAEAAALDPLVEGCPALETLDLQNNKLEGGEAVLAACARLPALKCLYLKGNPLVSSMRSYRKATIAAIPTLTYLDDRPVFEVERLSAEAWCALQLGLCGGREAGSLTSEQRQEQPNASLAGTRQSVAVALAELSALTAADSWVSPACACRARGGVEAEREARAAHRQREQEGERRRVAALRELRQAGWKKKVCGLGPGVRYLPGCEGSHWVEGVQHQPGCATQHAASLPMTHRCFPPLPMQREAMGLAGSGDPDLPDLPDDWEPDDEPAELRETREQLAAFTAGRQLQQGEQEVPGGSRTGAQQACTAGTSQHFHMCARCAGLIWAQIIHSCHDTYHTLMTPMRHCPLCRAGGR